MEGVPGVQGLEDFKIVWIPSEKWIQLIFLGILKINGRVPALPDSFGSPKNGGFQGFFGIPSEKLRFNSWFQRPGPGGLRFWVVLEIFLESLFQ